MMKTLPFCAFFCISFGIAGAQSIHGTFSDFYASTSFTYTFFDNDSFTFTVWGHMAAGQSRGKYERHGDTLILNSATADTTKGIYFFKLKDARFLIKDYHCISSLSERDSRDYCRDSPFNSLSFSTDSPYNRRFWDLYLKAQIREWNVTHEYKPRVHIPWTIGHPLIEIRDGIHK
jgi:hypothetical protein